MDAPWSRAADVERVADLARRYSVFLRAEADNIPAALLHLLAAARRVYVANIVPVDPGGLTMEQYNRILVEFAERFGQAAALDLGLTLNIGSDVVDLGEELDSNTFSALLAFSRGSTRSTGSSHPLDRERWYAFLVQLHRSGGELGTGVLQEFLIRDGWSESVTWDLVIQFEFGMGLLRYVEQR